MDFLRAAAARGSEPTRNQFSKVIRVFSREDEMERLVLRIGAFQEGEQAEKLRSFYSALALNVGYFWKVSKDDPHLRARCATDIVLFGYRLLLQENRVLKPLFKRFGRCLASRTVLLKKGERLLADLSDEAVKNFSELVCDFIEYRRRRTGLRW